jgi:hypothetical protein
MSANFSWFISNAEVSTVEINNLKQVVVSCRWGCVANDSYVDAQGITQNITKQTFGYLNFDEPDPGSFVDFNNLKQSSILSWVWAKVDKSEIEDSLQEYSCTFSSQRSW